MFDTKNVGPLRDKLFLSLAACNLTRSLSYSNKS